MAPSGGQAGEIDRLKSLLFSPEAARLDAAEAHIEGLESRVGDARGLEAATAEILVEAFRRAEVARHRELAAAVAPVIVAAIRSEIHNSRDMMVEALYPITGRLVSAAVANAFRELVESINQRLDRLLSTSQWKIRLQSWFSGRPMAEIALAQARAPIFQRILLFERGSGRVIANWRLNNGREDNPELISGMIAAISEFATNVLADRQGELRTLDLGGSKIFLRASARIVLAAELIGEIRQKEHKRLDQVFLDLVDRQERGETVSNADLAALATELPSLGSQRSGWLRRVRTAIIVAILAALFGFLLSGPIQRWRKSAVITAAFEQGLAAEPGLGPYPLRLEIDHARRHVILRGLTGSKEQTDALVARVRPAAAPYDMAADVEILATASALQSTRDEIDGRFAAVATRLTDVDEKLSALADAARASTAEAASTAARDIGGLRGELAEELKARGAAIDALKSDVAGMKADSRARFDAADARAAILDGEIAATAKQLRDESAESHNALAAKVAALDGEIVSTAQQLRGESAESRDALAAKLGALEGKTVAAARQMKAESTESLDALTGKVGALERNVASAIQQLKTDSAAELDALTTKVGAVRSDLVSTTQQIRAESADDRDAFAAKMGALESNLAASAQQLRGESANGLGAISAKMNVLEANLALASRRIDVALGELASPHRRLLETAAQSAVFFGDDDNLIDPEAAAKALDALAPVIIASKEGLRVVGHADVTGGPAINAELSQRRAAKIAQMLRDRGVPANALVVVARGAQELIAVVAAGVAQVNRRVTFEPLLTGERAR